jgi:hypothetical protein
MMVRGGRSGGVFIGAMLDELDARSGKRAFKAGGESVGIRDVADHCELGTFKRKGSDCCSHSPRVRYAATAIDILNVFESVGWFAILGVESINSLLLSNDQLSWASLF